MNVALLVDLSGSVNGVVGGQQAVRDAATALVDALTGTPSQVAIHTFGTLSPAPNPSDNPNIPGFPTFGKNANLGLQSVATAGAAALVRAKAQNLTTSGLPSTQYTNWDQGLWQLQPLASSLDAVVVITDGMPTRYGPTATSTGDAFTRFIEVENAVASANAVKALGAKVISVGVGNGVTGAAASNLAAISGPVAGTDYFQVGWAALAAQMTALADEGCQGTVNVTKQVIPVGGTVANAAATSNWGFTATATGPTVRIDQAGTTFATSAAGATGATGVLGFASLFSGTTEAQRAMSITEVETAQYDLRPWTIAEGAHTAGDYARCATTAQPNTPLDIANILSATNPGFVVNPVENGTISCVVRNQAIDQTARLQVNKVWRIDTNGDGQYEETTQPNQAPTLIPASAALTLGGNAGISPTGPWNFGQLYANLVVGSTVAISETVSGLPALCTNSASFAPTLTGGTTTLSIPASQGTNTVTITNTVTCATRLTLEKSVPVGGTPVTEWTLDAIAPGGALAGPNGASGTAAATAAVTPGVVYPLAEAANTVAAQGYTQRWQPSLLGEWTANRTAGATGSWVCVQASSVVGGVPTWGTNQYDGRNGGVTVPAGGWAKCTAVNDPKPTLQLVKKISLNGVETVVPVGDTRWTLGATWTALTSAESGGNPGIVPFPGTQTSVSGPGGIAPTKVQPGHYALSESGTATGYTNGTSYSCSVNGAPGVPVALGGDLMLLAGDAAVCTIVNTAVAPKLTLVKTLVNDNGGTATVGQWTLSATTPGGPDLSGATATAAVTSAPIKAGAVYTLGETGPVGYDWTTLSCTGPHTGTTKAAPTLTLAPGEDVTCTFTNNDVPRPVVVEKSDATVTQLADFTWQVDYTVTVTNPSASLPATYSLTDTPDFESSFTVDDEYWVGDPVTTGVAIEPNGADQYTYRVIASTDGDVDDGALRCDPATGGGFFNTATVTYPGGTDSDTGCGAPAAPTVTKTAQASAQDPATGLWTLSYQIVVTNPSTIALAYELDDTAGALPTGVTGGAWAASDPIPLGGGTFVRNAAWAGSGQLATGTLPAGATHTYTVSRTVNVAATVTDVALTCGSVVNQGGGVWNTATVTNGIANDDSSDCAEIDRPVVEVEKTVTSTTQLADGTWEIEYDVMVTNPDADLAAVYNLADTLVFGGDIVVDGASWTGPTGGGDFAADGTATLATDRLIAAEGEDIYTVTVSATVDADAWSGDTLTCQDAEGPSAGGFLNTATVTVNGISIPADDCSEPALPTIEKVGVAATQDPDDPSRWLVSYDVTVTSGGYDTFYSLSDTPGFPVGVDLVSGTARRTDIPAQPVLTISTGADFVTDVPLGADDTHVYQVSWVVEITDIAVPGDADCTGEPGNGFFNTATLTVGAVPIDDADCIPVLDRVYPTVEKTATSTNQDPETGDWTVTYDIVVTLAAQGPANPKGLAAEYDLEDTLDFGGDINIGSAEWSGESSGDFDGPNDTAVLATDKAIAAGATHTYTVTVVAEVTAEAIADGTDECQSQEGGGGGFLNTALLSSGGQTTPVEACAEPIFPLIAKSAVGDAEKDAGTGLWTIEYDITVTYPVTDADPRPIVGYVLTDAPQLPDGVQLVGDWTVSAADADTPAPDEATWAGAGTWTIVTTGFDPEEDDITEHVYTVTAEVRVTEPSTVEPEVCGEGEQTGLVVINTAKITSGGYEDDDDACQVVHYDDVDLIKTPVLPADQDWVEPGDTFEYVLTVTNNGTRSADAVRVQDDDINDRLEILGLTVRDSEGVDIDPSRWGPAPGFVENDVDLTIAQLAVDETVVITIEVEFLAPEPLLVDHDGDPATEPIIPPLVGDEELPSVPDPLESLENTACVTALRDDNPDNNCDDVEIPVRDVTALVYTRCVNDAPLLGWVLSKSATLTASEIDFLWTPNDGDADTVPPFVELTQPGGTTTWANEIPWPGSAFTPSGISIDYPGWRPLAAADYAPGGGYYLPGTDTVMTAEEQAEFVFNGLILDPSELDFAWRGETTITFTVNPELEFETSYPPATPECFVARHTEVQIEKTASKERMTPGEAFTYTIEAENVSDDSAAEGVVITDAIPANIRITDVSWVGDSDPDSFPNYTECGVTGQAAGGYGGTLTCTLFGPLQPAGSGLGASAAPVITLAAMSNPATAATSIDNVAVVDYHTFGDPEDAGRDADNAVIYLSILAMTGSPLADGLIWAALLALFGGVLLMHVTRRRRAAGDRPRLSCRDKARRAGRGGPPSFVFPQHAERPGVNGESGLMYAARVGSERITAHVAPESRRLGMRLLGKPAAGVIEWRRCLGCGSARPGEGTMCLCCA